MSESNLFQHISQVIKKKKFFRKIFSRIRIEFYLEFKEFFILFKASITLSLKKLSLTAKKKVAF